MYYYIYCISRDKFWKPGRMGYTDNISEAGLYSFYQVASIVLAPFNKDELAIEEGKLDRFIKANVVSLASNISGAEESTCEPDCQSPDNNPQEN